MIAADVNSARARGTRLKGVNVVAQRRKGVDPAWCDEFIVSLTYDERFTRGELGSLSDDFEVTNARLALEPERAHARVWMTVRW